MYSGMTSSSACCTSHPIQETQTTSHTQAHRHDPGGNLSPGHLTKVLTNFSIDSIIGEQGPRYKDELEVEVLEDDLAQTSNHSKPNQNHNQKKFRPKNFACPVCRMAFSNNGQLKNHVRIHTGERPFQCNQTGCNRTFTRNEELTRHKLIHTGVRPHACPSCCKSFGRKDHLKKHARTHERKRTRKRPFVPAAGAPSIMSKSSSDNRLGRIIDPVYSPPSKRARVNSRAHGQLHPKGIISDCLPATSAAQLTLASVAMPINGRLSSSIGDFEQFNRTFAPPTPVTLAQNFTHLIDSDSAARTVANSLAVSSGLSMCGPPVSSVAAAVSTGAALQQLAGDYWHKWYSFLGLYHHQQQQQQQQQT